MLSPFQRKFQQRIAKQERLNITEVAYYLNCSIRTVHNYAKDKGLPKHGGKGTGVNGYYLKTEIDAWVRENPEIVFRF